MTVVVLSPHLDDAVLSAYTVTCAGAVVVNVFDGIPPEGTLSLWDRLCGATDSAVQARARTAEDESVLASLGAERRSLGLPDALNRTRDDALDFEEVVGLLDDELAVRDLPRDWVAPLAGGPKPHPDHRLVRDAALRLLEFGAIDSLRLYADVPYCVKLGGWPAAWGGDHPDPAWLGRALREARYVGAWWTAERVEIDAAGREAKLDAMRGYKTQFENLDRKLRVKGLVSNPAIYGAEVYWPAVLPRPAAPLSL